MQTKQIVTALALLILGVAVFGFLSARTTPLAQNVPPATTPASSHVEEGPYMHIAVEYPEASPAIRAQIERGMGDIVNTFKANASVDTLTPEDIAFIGLGETRKYALGAEYTHYTAPEYTSYAYTIYEDMLGAHPNVYYKTFVFDTNGTQVELGTILGSNPNWLEELSLVVSNKVVEEIKSRLASSLPAGEEGPDVTGSIFAEGLTPTEENYKNYAVDGNTLIIFIPPYQVAAYAVGSFEIRVPLADIQ